MEDNDKNNTLVSIITAVLNGAKYIELAILSVLNQTYPNIEHIIIDGNSCDGTQKILADYAKKYPNRIRFISEPDKGSGDAWNKGLKLSRGEVIGPLCGDDIYEREAVGNVVNFFQANSDACFVYGGINYIDAQGKLIKAYPAQPFNFKKLLNDYCMIPTPSSFYRRKLLETLGGFDSIGNDFDFFLRVAKKFPIYHIDKILSNYRVHPGSQNSGANIKSRLMWKRDDCLIGRKYGARFFSGYRLRYYKIMVLAWLETIKTFACKLLGKNRQKLS